MLDFVPGLAINGGDHALTCSHARVVESNCGRFRWRRGGGRTSLTENPARLLGKCRSAFPLVQPECPLGGDSCPVGVTARRRDRCQRQACVAVIDQQVGALGQADRGLGDPSSLRVIARAR